MKCNEEVVGSHGSIVLVFLIGFPDLEAREVFYPFILKKCKSVHATISASPPTTMFGGFFSPFTKGDTIASLSVTSLSNSTSSF
jgi:hypothetical protein